MLRLFNTHGRKMEVFKPVNPKVINIFTCGPSVYQRSHVGNFRTFLFEDVLVRYLEFLGYHVHRGMNFTDVEDKAIEEAKKRRTTLEKLTGEHIKNFLDEMTLLKMKIPDYLPKASEAIDEAVEAIEKLLDLKIAYWHKGNVYFDSRKYPRFGKLFGLDMTRWPKKKRRFHRDTYPGMRWNLGDFILWHGEGKSGGVSWDTRIGKGRPSWNIQDAVMISRTIHETLSIYCGGIDNLYRHHDYTLAILESIRPYPMSKFWLHCQHLIVKGRKMSKSLGNIYYTDTLLDQGYRIDEVRFFLLYGHYRKKLNYSKEAIDFAAEKLSQFKKKVKEIEGKRDPRRAEGKSKQKARSVFSERMGDDLDVKGAFDGLYNLFTKIDADQLKPEEASGYLKGLKEIDEVLKVIF